MNKRFLAGLLAAVLAWGSSTAFAADGLAKKSAAKVIVNEKTVKADTYEIDGAHYVKLADLARHLLLTTAYDAKENVLSIKSAPDGSVTYNGVWYLATLNDYAPTPSKTVKLTVVSSDGRKLPYTAVCHYKTTTTAYEGKTNEETDIKIGAATDGLAVIIDITVKDGDKKYALYTAFTPKKK